jgi:hypothetical protein
MIGASSSAAVIVACTLAGGVEDQNSTTRPETCRVGSHIGDCASMDRQIHPAHIIILWCIALGGLLLLGLPTVLSRKPHGMQHVAVLFVRTLCIMAVCVMSEHASLNYAMSAHATIVILVHMEMGPQLWGGARWWGLRYALAGGLLAYMALHGPAVSLVRWPHAEDTRTCAFIVHLCGTTVPGLVIDAMHWIARGVRLLALRDA